MLVIPEASPLVATLVGHDPGSDTFGVGIMQINILSLDIVQSEAFTLKGAKLGKGTWETEMQGEMIGRIWGIEQELYEIYRRYEPWLIGSEVPFIGRFPQAGIVLTRVMSSIHHAIRRYDPWKVLHKYEPGVVKNAVGADGRVKKDPVREGILKLKPVLHYCGETPLEALDEHSIDSLAVCMAMLLELREEAGLL
jgi:Holliday junction resolvasome RuvABC endonuclease subunit